MTEFDWNNEETVVKQVDAIAVYTNGHNDIVIRQQDQIGGDSFIIVPQDHAKVIIKAIVDSQDPGKIKIDSINKQEPIAAI